MTPRFRVLVGFAVLALAAGSVFFWLGDLDQAHWQALVQGLASVIAGAPQ